MTDSPVGPKRLPTVTTDRLLLSMRCLGDQLIQLDLRFRHALDPERLKTALDLLLDAEPVLGCRMVDGWRPYWQRLNPEERSRAGLLTVVDSAEEYDRFRLSVLDPLEGPMVRACLMPDSDGDRLLIQVRHECADAGGTREVATRLAEIYTRLGEQPDFIPAPNWSGSRGLWQIFRRVPFYAYPRIYAGYLRDTIANAIPPRILRVPTEKGPVGDSAFVVRHIDEARVREFRRCCRLTEATLNDLIMAAFFRAQLTTGDWNGRDHLRLISTVDLRRWYLPDQKGGGICNLSAFAYTRLGRRPGADFNETFQRVALLNSKRKKAWIGLNDHLGLLPTHGLPHRLNDALFRGIMRFLKGSRLLANALTNLGPLCPKQLCFDDPPRRAWMLTPNVEPPQFVMGLSGYADTLTLSVGVHPESMTTVSGDAFVDAMLDQLPG